MMAIAENFWLLMLVTIVVLFGLGYRLSKRRSRGEVSAGPLQEVSASVDGLHEHSWDLAAIEWSLQHQPEVTSTMLRDLCLRAGATDTGRPLIGSSSSLEPERLVAILENHLGISQNQTPPSNRESEYMQ